jgi:YVTN family beta-propeller protein
LLSPPTTTALTLNPRAYIPSPANRAKGSLLVVEGTQDIMVTPPITLGSDPVDVAINPTGTRVFVADDVDNTVTVIDPTTAGNPEMLVMDPALQKPSFLAMAPDGGRLYVSNKGNGQVSIINTAEPPAVIASPTVVMSGELGMLIAVNVPGVGTRVYVAWETPQQLLVLDADGTLVGDPLQLPNRPLALGRHPDGGFVYVTFDHSNLVVLNTLTNEQTNIDLRTEFGLTTSNFLTRGVDVTPVYPDGSQFLVIGVRSPDSVRVYPLVEGMPQGCQAAYAVGHNPLATAVSADGKYAYVLSNTDNRVSWIDPRATNGSCGDTQKPPQASDVVDVSVQAWGRFTAPAVGACGNHVVDPGEQCDDGAANGTPGSCCTLNCVAKPDNTSCNDNNACTQNDVCTNGTCGGTAFTCAAPDQCHQGAGTCNGDGTCSFATKPDNTSCNDGNACTKNDVCTGGTCAGTSFTCAAPDQCHQGAGTCNGDGTCSFADKPNGTTCNDNNACTQTDTCQAGACVGANPVTCGAADQCHAPGTCDPAIGTCTTPAKPDGTSCDDGNACTQRDACQGGVCTGTTPVTCAALDQCHVAGICDPATGMCSQPAKSNGSMCDDGDLCTAGDTCQAGGCQPGPRTACIPPPPGPVSVPGPAPAVTLNVERPPATTTTSAVVTLAGYAANPSSLVADALGADRAADSADLLPAVRLHGPCGATAPPGTVQVTNCVTKAVKGRKSQVPVKLKLNRLGKKLLSQPGGFTLQVAGTITEHHGGSSPLAGLLKLLRSR